MKKPLIKDLPKIAHAIADIVWMGRRYAEGRRTGAPHIFNEAYKELSNFIDFDEENDPDKQNKNIIKHFPLASSGYKLQEEEDNE